MFRVFGIVLSFLLALALAGWALAVSVGPRALADGIELYQYRQYFDRILGDTAPRATRPMVVWLGDSTIMGGERPSYPQLLRGQLHRKNADSLVIAGAAFDPYIYYFAVGRVIERLNPSVVIMVAHLAAFSPRGSARIFRYNDLSSYITPAQLPRAFLLPLAERELSPARLLLAQALNFDGPKRIFFGAEGLRELYAKAPFWAALGPPRPPRVFNPRMRDTLTSYNVRVSRRQPTVRMLEAAVRVVTEAGRVAMVIATPIPHEALATRAWHDPAKMQQGFDVLREVVEGAGGMFVDLHRLLPQREFADYGGHFAATGAQHMSYAVWPMVREALRRASLAHTADGTGTPG
ncbi:MAG TPA: hypothetical protein VNO26_06255 [Candidatus Limnocylindria bacterium]|nr:hypothetical protein [Candidatus Limnocylindria bacterium]